MKFLIYASDVKYVEGELDTFDSLPYHAEEANKLEHGDLAEYGFLATM